MTIDVRGVRAVMIFAADPSASSRWWAELLGGTVRSDASGFHWMDVAGDVELGFHPADPAKNPAGSSTVAYWRVESVARAVDEVRRAGGSLHRGPLEAETDRWIAQVRDPFGAILGFDGGR